MSLYTDKHKNNTSRAISNNLSGHAIKRSSSGSIFHSTATPGLADPSASAIVQRYVESRDKVGFVPPKQNNTGLPDNLKSGVEKLSGFSLDDVKVHYNSAKPTQLRAHAFAQGTDIHIASGQERHLAHEAWHVIQQKQGRVKATQQVRQSLNINDDAALETEADRMGVIAQSAGPVQSVFQSLESLNSVKSSQLVQRNRGRFCKEVYPEEVD